MLYLPLLISIIEVLLLTLPILFVVAFVTIAERKTMASMQRRLGPDTVGYYGLLQAFADALKLLLKEYVSPTQSNFILFFISPIITLIFSLIGYAVIPFGPGISIADLNLGILYMLAVSSLSTYGILLAGWSANSKYAFLGSLRSTAQLISYELILSSAIVLVVLLTGSLNLSVNVEAQNAIWFIVPLLPVFIIFYIGSIAETNRAPFDLAEAESELVSGFMTEHAAVIFVFFFLAEYASIVLICILTSLLFLGGYMYDYGFLVNLAWHTDFDRYLDIMYNNYTLQYNPLFEGLAYGLSIGLKTCIMIFIFIWVRASFPRIRFDQLMSFCWTIILPIVIALIILVPCILYSFETLPADISLLYLPFMIKKEVFNKINKRFYSTFRPDTRILGQWLTIGLVALGLIGAIHLFIQFNTLTNILCLPLSFIPSFLFTGSFVLLYLDNFSLSNNKVIKYIQIFSFLFIPLFTMYNLYNLYNMIDFVNYIKDSDIDLHAHGHISVDKEAGKAIGQGLNTIGSNIGLGASITGLGMAVAKGIAKSSMPPLQKAGVIIGAGLIGGLSHSRINNINRRTIMQENIENNTNGFVNNSSSGLNKLIDDTIPSSPLQDLLLDSETTNYVCISLIIILIIQILFKFHLKDNINLNLSNILGNNINTRLEYYLNKIIMLNKKMSIVYIWLIFIILIFALSVSAYVYNDLYTNIDSYVNIHNSLNSVANDSTNSTVNKLIYGTIPSSPLKDLLLNLEIINYVCISLIIILIIQVLFKLYLKDNININLSWVLGNNINTRLDFYLNKIIKLNNEMSIVYIWLILIALIFALFVSAYLCNDLYTNIDSHLSVYNSLNTCLFFAPFTVKKNISPLDLEQLQLEFYSHILIIYLLIIVFVFLLMKSLSRMSLKFEFLKNIPFLQTLLLKLMHWWGRGKTSIIWVYVILISILLSIIISTWSIYIILNNVSDISNISAFDLEQLQLEFYLHITIAYLLIIVLVFLLSKSYNSMNFKFKFLKNIPFLQRLFVKLMHWWGIPSISSIYVMLIIILTCMAISAWDIYTIINNISLVTNTCLLFVPFMVKENIFNKKKIIKKIKKNHNIKQAAKIFGTGLANTGLIGARIKVIIGTALYCLATNPPKPHAFVSIQLHSGFYFNWILFMAKLKEKCTIWNGIKLFIPPFLGYSLKVYVSNRWGVELNDFCVYMATYGVIGGFVKLVKFVLDSFEVIKDSNTLKMEAAGGNIPTQPGAGGAGGADGAGGAGPAPGPQAIDVNEISTRRDNGTHTIGLTDQDWNIDRNYVFPDYHEAVDRGDQGKILANMLEYDNRVNKRSVINTRTQINNSARAFLYNHFRYYRNLNHLNYGASIPNNFSLRDSLRNLR